MLKFQICDNFLTEKLPYKLSIQAKRNKCVNA